MKKIIENPEILFVDDSRTSRRLARKILQPKYRVLTCTDGSEAWDLLRSHPSIKIVFSDIQMAEMNGMELLRRIRNAHDSRLSSTPVIMITGSDDDDATMRAVFEMGATDFISKPFKTMDLLSRSYSYIKLNERIEKLEQDSGVDSSSGLLNSTGFKQNADRLLAFAQRHRTSVTLAKLEILELQRYTQSHGANVAQQIFSNIAARLSRKLRREDIVARVGSSRMAILLPLCNSKKAYTTVTRIQRELENIVFECGTEKFSIEVAAGATTVDDGEEHQLDELLLQADAALMEACTRKTTRYVSHQNTERADDQMKILEHAVSQFTDSLVHIVEGNYHKIDDEHLQPLIQKLEAFLEYKRDPMTPDSI